MTSIDFITPGRRTVVMERDAVAELEARIGEEFAQVCRLMFANQGRVIVLGIGKSGHIGRKIAATLASTGTPAFFVHPAEAGHGDFGMITAGDLVLAISNSGNSPEIVSLLPMLRRLGLPIIAMTGNPQSTLAQGADLHLDVSVRAEACPLDLAPTSSTTAALVMGDALAVALLEARGFTAEDFAFSHPGGSLGRRLVLRVEDVMRGGLDVPNVLPQTPLFEALGEMSAKGLGMTTVTDEQGTLLGIFTDGDLRRALNHGADLHRSAIAELMTHNPRSVQADTMAIHALHLMEQAPPITALVVINSSAQPIGVLHMHQLIKAGLV